MLEPEQSDLRILEGYLHFLQLLLRVVQLLPQRHWDVLLKLRIHLHLDLLGNHCANLFSQLVPMTLSSIQAHKTSVLRW